MSGSMSTLRLRTPQARSALQLLRETRSGRETEALLSGLREILGAAVVVSCNASILADGTKTFRGTDSGFTPNEREKLAYRLICPEHEDPAAEAHIASMTGAADGEPSTALRRDLVLDGAWYNSGYVAEIRRGARLDDSICSMRLDNTAFVGLLALRAWGDRPFEEEDRDLLHLVHLEWQQTPAPRSALDESRFAPREAEVLRFLLSGYADKEIAARMQLSVFTVNDYCKRIYRKAGVKSRGELQALAAGRRL